MTKNSHAGSADQPKQGREWRGNQTQRDGDDEKARVQLRGSGTESADFKIAAVQASNEPHTDYHEDDIEQEEPVGQKSVQAQHAEDDSIVAGEVAQVVIDARLHLAKVGGLGESLEVEKLRDGPQVGEATSQRARGEA